MSQEKIYYKASLEFHYQLFYFTYQAWEGLLPEQPRRAARPLCTSHCLLGVVDRIQKGNVVVNQGLYPQRGYQPSIFATVHCQLKSFHCTALILCFAYMVQ